MLLAPELVMKTQGLQIVTVCDSLMSDMRTEGILIMTRLMETFVRASPVLGAETIQPILPRIFQLIYQDVDATPIIMSNYLSILARVLLASHAVFTDTIARLSQAQRDSEQNILGSILDIWLSKMCNVSQAERRKLLALALANLLTTQSRPVIERLNGVMLNILEALNDINGQSPSDFNEDTDSYYETDHDQRKRQLVLSDPIHNIVLKDYFQSQVSIVTSQLIVFRILFYFVVFRYFS